MCVCMGVYFYPPSSSYALPVGAPVEVTHINRGCGSMYGTVGYHANPWSMGMSTQTGYHTSSGVFA